MTTTRLGMRLKQLRTARGMTQVALANKARVTQGYIAQLERGIQKDPSLSTLKRLAKALDVKPSALLD